MKPPSNKFWTGIGLFCLAFIVVLRWSGTESTTDHPDSPASLGDRGDGVARSNAGKRMPAGSASTPASSPRLYSDVATLEAADERGELMGTKYGPRTPEDLLFDVAEGRAEPFALLVLDHLEKALPSLKEPRDQVRAAALLHRYGRERGTDFLRDYLKTNMGTPDAEPAATTLAMSKDEKSLPLIVGSIKGYIGGSEFDRAIARWGEPALLAEVKSLLNDPSVRSGRAAFALAYAGDKSAIPLLP